MFERPLRYLAILVGTIIALSFGLFARDETNDATRATSQAIATQTAVAKLLPSPTEERARERAHTDLREYVDDANDILTAPFAGLVNRFQSGWARRGVSSILAMLLWAVGLGYLARYSSGRMKRERAAHHTEHGLHRAPSGGPQPPSS